MQPSIFFLVFPLDITVKLTTLYRSKLTTLLSGEKVFKLSGEE
jgi:hypothetical protein